MNLVSIINTDQNYTTDRKYNGEQNRYASLKSMAVLSLHLSHTHLNERQYPRE